MKKKIIKDSEGITQEDIDEAIALIHQCDLAALGLNKESARASNVVDDGKCLTFHHEPDPTSPYEYVREGKPLKIKTVFHDIDLEFEDGHGGTFTCSYSMRETAAILLDRYRQNFPLIKETDIRAYAKAKGKDFATAKKECTLIVANKIIKARGEIAKFLHTELEPTLKMTIAALLDDAFLFSLREFGQLVDGTKQFEKQLKPYLKYRKQRTKVVRSVGRQKGEKEKVYSQDCELLKNKILSAMRILATEGKIQKGKIADEIWGDVKFGKISGGHQKLVRELEKFGLDYDEILEEFCEKINI